MDAFVSDTDALFAEYQSCGLAFHEPLADTSDGLRAFELRDHDGYVLCFGKPLCRRIKRNKSFWGRLN